MFRQILWDPTASLTIEPGVVIAPNAGQIMQ